MTQPSRSGWRLDFHQHLLPAPAIEQNLRQFTSRLAKNLDSAHWPVVRKIVWYLTTISARESAFLDSENRLFKRPH